MQENQEISHFKILKKIAEGGMGEIYLAEDTRLKRRVALKFLPPFLEEDATAKQRFLREARLAGVLEHPFICSIYEVGEVEGRGFIAMEYVSGETLRERLDTEPIPWQEAVQITQKVADALESAHRKGIVHRDLKPDNLKLTEQGFVKIMDFGLAKSLRSSEARRETADASLTQHGMAVGTLSYMSPEQVRGQQVDARSDIFSLGIILYESLTGKNPFVKRTMIETATSIVRDTPPPVHEARKGIPTQLDSCLSKALAKNLPDRFQSAQEFNQSLEEASASASARGLWPKISSFFSRK